MSGRGSMNHVAREFAWRRAVYEWFPSFEHLPGELNVRADALSRLFAPAGQAKCFPRSLTGVPESVAPELESTFWRCWLEAPPTRTREKGAHSRKRRL